MRVHVIFAHPVETSFNAAMHRMVVETLTDAGHEVDDCDLYAEGFDAVLSRQERLNYHDTDINRQPVAAYVDRLLNAEALVFVHPIWNFGLPAILKGYMDRVLLPGVSFHISDGKLSPGLLHLRKLACVVTYGAQRWRAMVLGDPPRKIATRMMRATMKPGTPVWYLAQYDMNNVTDAQLQQHMERTRQKLLKF